MNERDSMAKLDYVLGYASIKPLVQHAVAPNPINQTPADVRNNWDTHTDTTVFVWEPVYKLAP